MPSAAAWTEPQGGYCCWLTLPPGVAAGEVYRAALEAGLLLAPGDVFLVGPSERGHLRLCYGNVAEDDIHTGMELLGSLIRRQAGRDPARQAPLMDRAPLV